MIDVSIIIVSYNTKEMTLACLRSLFEQTKSISYETILVDNASNDDSASAVENHFPELTLIKSSQNLGFASANNLAALNAKGRYLLLLNPDTVVLDRAVEKLHAVALQHPKNRIYGGRTLYADHSLNPTSCWKRPSIWSLLCYSIGLSSIFKRNLLFDPESYGQWQRDSVRTVDIVTGCLLMIEKELWQQLGGFDQEFFMYGEDADLCLRAINTGARPIITPDATIIHYAGASEQILGDKLVRLYKAKMQLIRKHLKPAVRWAAYSLLFLGVFLRAASHTLCSNWFPERFRINAGSWKELWTRRREWTHS